MAYTLHCFAQSGNAYKPALMLQLIGEDWTAEFVDFFNGAARSEDYLRDVNEMGEVPVLVDGTTRLTQSAVMLDYLSSKHGKFGGGSADERREILRWMFWDNHKLTANLATARFMQLFLPEKHRKPEVIAFLMGRAGAALKILDARLEGRDWIVGDRLTTADLSCIGYMYFLEEIGITEDAFPNVFRWRAAIADLPEWKHPYDLMPGHPLPGAS